MLILVLREKLYSDKKQNLVTQNSPFFSNRVRIKRSLPVFESRNNKVTKYYYKLRRHLAFIFLRIDLSLVSLGIIFMIFKKHLVYSSLKKTNILTVRLINDNETVSSLGKLHTHYTVRAMTRNLIWYSIRKRADL